MGYSTTAKTDFLWCVRVKDNSRSIRDDFITMTNSVRDDLPRVRRLQEDPTSRKPCLAVLPAYIRYRASLCLQTAAAITRYVCGLATARLQLCDVGHSTNTLTQAVTVCAQR